MTNWEELDIALKASGHTDTSISIATGHSHGWMHSKRKRKADFNSSEITSLCKEMKVSTFKREEIFFAANVDFKST